MTTTTQIREWWAPACDVNFARIELYGDGVVSVEKGITSAVNALNEMLKRHSYETRKDDTGAYNCRRITGGTNYSLHAYGIAIDINWLTNPYGSVLKTDMPPAMIEDIKRIKTKNGKQVWRWGGDYSGNKDAMHFEIIVAPADLINGVIIPKAPQPAEKPQEATPVIWHIEGSPYTFLQKDAGMCPLTEKEFWNLAGKGMPVKSIPNKDFVAMNKQLHDLAKRPLQPV